MSTVLAALAVAGLVAGGPAGAEVDLARLAEKGEGIFQQKCSPCHTIGEGDRSTGPDLSGVTERRDRQWLVRMIQEPGRLIAERDPVALELLARFNNLPMPALGLNDVDLQAVLAYLSAPAEEQHHPPEPAAVAPPAGDPLKGRALFVGAVPFARGGAPCLGCHGIAGAGLGMAAGASFAADLTSMYEDYGAEGVTSILESLPFPSMEPIYAGRPLSATEQADVTAFLAEVAGHPPIQAGGQLIGHVAVGVVIMLGLLVLFGWGRLKGVRQPLVDRARKGKGEPR
ncbi:MAG TPA: cytochrome c [Desulfuromonadales bacterium]